MIALVTGFGPYGKRGRNPTADIVKQIDGSTIGSVKVVGRALPAVFRPLAQSLRGLIKELDPAFVLSLGLWPGDPTVRLERIGINVADFEIPDNEGELISDQPLIETGANGLFSTLPLRRIEQALLEAGIPIRISNSAGTFMCNTALYTCLSALKEMKKNIPCGFMHVPYLPEQVAEIISENKKGKKLELEQRSDLASMSLDTMVEAVKITIRESLA